MIFEFTNDYKFTTRLQLKNENVEVIEKTRLLGTIISNDIKWDQNISTIVKKVNGRMELLAHLQMTGRQFTYCTL